MLYSEVGASYSVFIETTQQGNDEMHAIIAQAEDLSAAQLVALYNKYAEQPVKKFSSRAIGIKRVTEVIQNALAAQVEQNQKETTMNAITETTVEQVEQISRIALDASEGIEIALPEVTDLERRLLLGVAESDFQDGSDPEECKLVWSWSATNFLSSKKSAGALVASLVKKGLLNHTPKHGDCDECIGFTALGAKVYRAKVEKAPMPSDDTKAAKAKRERKAKVAKVETKRVIDASDKVALDASDDTKATKAKVKRERVKAEKPAKAPKAPSKVEIMFGMILQEGGELKSELLKVCGWKGCAIALGRACEKAGMELKKEKVEKDWRYSAVAKIEA